MAGPPQQVGQVLDASADQPPSAQRPRYEPRLGDDGDGHEDGGHQEGETSYRLVDRGERQERMPEDPQLVERPQIAPPCGRPKHSLSSSP